VRQTIINPATGRAFDDLPQPAWMSFKDEPGVITLVMIQAGEIICLLAVVRPDEEGRGEYKLPHTGEHGKEATLDAAMLKVQEIIGHHAGGGRIEVASHVSS
jgi:hypothetical protein